jgi:hypothetical protein
MGEWVGYFYTNNSSQDIVCLLYKGQKACTSVGQNTTVKQISESIKGIFVTEAQNQAKKKQVQMLFEFGASKPKLTPTDDKVGVFNTTKASYTTDYKGLTVQQLNALGLSANDQNIYKIDDHTTTFWVDKKTGLTVKNRIEWVESGGDRYYQNAYSVVDLSPQIMPPLPENLTSVSGFAAFYNLIGQYSTELAACGAETDAVKKGMCYKKMAFERGDGELCTLIANQDERERCLLVVAQLTENATLCQNVVVIKDDCLIAVAGQNGDEALCAQVQNQSLSGICQEAVVAGKKKKADATAAQNGATPKNCVADSDCVIGGSFNQTCAPKTAQIAIGGNYSPFYSCVQNLPCACSEGYCGFATNENYTQCVGDIEDSIIEKLLNNTKENKTQTSNGSG